MLIESNSMVPAKVYEVLLERMEQSNRMVLSFVIIASVWNLVVLVLESLRLTFSAAPVGRSTLIVITALVLAINGIAVAVLFIGRRTRKLLVDALVSLLEDSGAIKYYPPYLRSEYSLRYVLYGAVMLLLAAASIVIPILTRGVA